MDGKTICNHCTGMIPEGEGSLFYSSASLFHDATKETGNIFLCEKCTDLPAAQRVLPKSLVMIKRSPVLIYTSILQRSPPR